MGLDQYAYVAFKGQREKYYEGAVWNNEAKEFENNDTPAPQELAYWRKHPNLQGWMEALYRAKGGTGEFNGDEVELTWEDVDMLEHDIKNGHMSHLGTTGFFFGNPSDDYYKEKDLKFCLDAKAELFLGRKVFYNSSW